MTDPQPQPQPIDPADHVRLVGFVLDRFFSHVRRDWLPELRSAGGAALVRACQLFDASAGNRPSTYLTACIRWRCVRRLEELARDERRRAHPRVGPVGEPFTAPEPADRRPGPDEEAAALERARLLRRAVERLREHHPRVAGLIDLLLAGLSVREAAARMGYSYQRAYQVRDYAYDRLRDLLPPGVAGVAQAAS